MKFLINIDCFGTYNVEYMYSEIQMFQIQGDLNQFTNGSRTKFGCLKAILSCLLENELGVLLLWKISRNLVEFKTFKTPCKFLFFQIRIDLQN